MGGEIFKYLIGFFDTEKKGFSKRLLGLVILLLLAFILNINFGLTRQYKFEKDMSNLNMIDDYLKSPNLDKNVVIFLENKRNEIIEFGDFNENNIYVKPKNEILKFLDFKKFNIIHYLTSSWLFLVFLIHIPFSLIRKKTMVKGTFFISRLMTIFSMMFLLYLFSILYASLLQLMPIFSYKYLWLNYIFNFLSILIVVPILYTFFELINIKGEYANSKGEILNEIKSNEIAEKKENPAGLKNLLDKQNPLLWSGEIIKHYTKRYENKWIARMIMLFSIVLVVYFFYCVILTTYNIFSS